MSQRLRCTAAPSRLIGAAAAKRIESRGGASDDAPSPYWLELARLLLLALVIQLRPFSAGFGPALTFAEPTLSNTASMPLAEPSFVRLPLRIPLQAAFEQLEKRIPTRIGASKGFEAYRDGIQVRYSITRDALQLKPEHDRLEVRDALHYWLESRGGQSEPARCGDASSPILVDVGWNVRLGWQDDWKLDSRTTQIPTQFARRCRAGPEESSNREAREKPDERESEGVDFTDFLNDRIAAQVVQPMTSGLDSTLHGLSEPRRSLEAAWKALEQPVDLEGGSVWLSWNVEGVVAEPVVLSAGAVECQLALIVRPLVALGARPTVASVPLPGTKVRLTGEQLLVTLDCAISLDAVNAKLRPSGLSARETAGTSLEITGIRLGGAGDRVEIAVDLGGRVARQVRLAGRLAYHPESFRLAVEELDYTRESQAVLFGSGGKQVAGLRRDCEALRRGLADDLRFDLEKRVPSAMVQLGRGLNRRLVPGVSIHGGVNDLRTLGTYVTDRALGVRLAAAGKVALEIQ